MQMQPTPMPNPLTAPTKELVPSPRIAWVDNLRTAMILLVVNMHACVTYSHVGGWFITLPPDPNLKVKILFLFWQGHLQSFFMGLLFFIAGYFAEKSIVKKGTELFLRERWMRLGMPTLFFMLVIWPLTVWGIIGNPKVENLAHLAQLYRGYTLSGRPFFRAAVLYGLRSPSCYSVWCLPRYGRFPEGPPCPDQRRAAANFCFFVQDWCWRRFLRGWHFRWRRVFFNFQLSYFAQDIAGFWMGALSARHGWLSSLADSPLARRAVMVGLVGGPILLLTGVLSGLAEPPDTQNVSVWRRLALAGVRVGVLGTDDRPGVGPGNALSILAASRVSE